MNKRKLLSIVLSFALVFSMTSAFTIASYADEQSVTPSAMPDAAYTHPEVSQVTVNGVNLENDGDFVESNKSEKGTGNLPDSGYALFKDGRLILNNFKLENVSKLEYNNKSAISVTSTNGTNTLYIDIIGENSISMAADNSAPAISAPDCYLVFSSKKYGSKLEINSNYDGIYAEIIDIQSGNYVLKGKEQTSGTAGLYAYDVIVSGGDVDINDYFFGIYGDYRAIVNDGSLDIDNCLTGIAAYSPIINGGSTGIQNCEFGVFSLASSFLKGGKVSIKTNLLNKYGIFSNDGNIEIDGGNIDIENYIYGVHAQNDFVMDRGDLFINNSTSKAIIAVNEVLINNGNINIRNEIDNDSLLPITMNQTEEIANFEFNDDVNNQINNIDKSLRNGGNIKPVLANEMFYGLLTQEVIAEPAVSAESGVQEQVPNNAQNSHFNGIYAYSGDITVNDGTINLSFKNINSEPIVCGNYAFEAYDDSLFVNGGEINIDGYIYGLAANKSLSINNAAVDITADNPVLCGNSAPTVKNSDIKLQSSSNDPTCTAFSPTVKVSGNPAIYAGSTEKDAKRIVLNKKDLGQYQYVHIYKGGSVILSNIYNVFTNLFTSLFKLTDSSIFSGSALLKLLSSVFNIG